MIRRTVLNNGLLSLQKYHSKQTNSLKNWRKLYAETKPLFVISTIMKQASAMSTILTAS